MSGYAQVIEAGVGASDDILRQIFGKVGEVAEAGVKKIVVIAPTVPGKVGNVVTKKVIPFVTEHPTLTASVASAVTGGLIATAIQQQQQGKVTAAVDPYGFNTIYDPNSPAVKSGTVTGTPVSETEQGDKKDYGLVGNALAWTSTTLFGQTGEEVANFVDGAKPWVVAAGVITAIVAVGYTAKALQGNRQTVRFE